MPLLPQSKRVATQATDLVRGSRPPLPARGKPSTPGLALGTGVEGLLSSFLSQARLCCDAGNRSGARNPRISRVASLPLPVGLLGPWAEGLLFGGRRVPGVNPKFGGFGQSMGAPAGELALPSRSHHDHPPP